jgi:hypothetical protein
MGFIMTFSHIRTMYFDHILSTSPFLLLLQLPMVLPSPQTVPILFHVLFVVVVLDLDSTYDRKHVLSVFLSLAYLA